MNIDFFPTNKPSYLAEIRALGEMLRSYLADAPNGLRRDLIRQALNAIEERLGVPPSSEPEYFPYMIAAMLDLEDDQIPADWPNELEKGSVHLITRMTDEQLVEFREAHPDWHTGHARARDGRMVVLLPQDWAEAE